MSPITPFTFLLISKYYSDVLWDVQDVQRTITNSKSNEQCELSFWRNEDTKKMNFKVKRSAKEKENSRKFQPVNCDDMRFFRSLFG